MIKVCELDGGLFLVHLDDKCEKELCTVADHTNDSTAAIVRAILITAISVLVKDVLSERNQDGLEGKDERMGRG